MKKNHKGKILNIETVAKDTVKMCFTTELEDILPGQFVSVLIPDKTLRRPFSVADFAVRGSETNAHCEQPVEGCEPAIIQEADFAVRVDNSGPCGRHPEFVSGSYKGIITVIFKVKGDGTNYLKTLKIGDTIDYLAPLGNTFTLAKEGQKALLIGAGIGIAPMLYLKKTLQKKSVETYLISGFKDEAEVVKGSDKTVIGGSVLDNIQTLIDEFKPEIIYSCGPRVVLEMVCDIAKKNDIKAEIAMEKVMACGIGVCRGCVIRLNTENGPKNASVCADGPVFCGSEVIWEE